MGSSGIAWTQATWNPTTGCTKVSAGCKHCYAERMAKRLAGRFGYPADEPFKVTLQPDRLVMPLHWKKPRRVFVDSMSDLFHQDVPDEYILNVFATMQLTRHTYQVLTKRPERMAEWCQRWAPDPLPNVWLGTSVENQTTAEERIPWLLKTPAAVRWISAEPLLKPVDLRNIPYHGDRDYFLDVLSGRYRASFSDLPDDGTAFAFGLCNLRRLDWVVVGCESGPGRRPMLASWARLIRDDCNAARVPFFLKQMEVDGVIVETPALDGMTWTEYPA